MLQDLGMHSSTELKKGSLFLFFDTLPRNHRVPLTIRAVNSSPMDGMVVRLAAGMADVGTADQ